MQTHHHDDHRFHVKFHDEKIGTSLSLSEAQEFRDAVRRDRELEGWTIVDSQSGEIVDPEPKPEESTHVPEEPVPAEEVAQDSVSE